MTDIGTSWMQTNSGQIFRFDEPDASMIVLHDIAHALSNITRFAGHVDRFFSVAAHSMLVMHIVDRMMDDGRSMALINAKRCALMHDAAEAYVGELTRPLKSLLLDYCAVEMRVERAIAERFSLNMTKESSVVIRRADLASLEIERQILFDVPPAIPYETSADIMSVVDRVGSEAIDMAMGMIGYDSKVAFLNAAHELGIH